MGIHFITGKPGGGKTLYAVRLCIGELTRGNRVIVTNVPLKLDELNAYLQEEFPKIVVDIHTRIILLSDELTKEFWLTRPGWYGAPDDSIGWDGRGYRPLTPEDWKRGRTPDYSGVKDNGVVYVIDEVHNFFGSRQWAETGRDATFYLSQHRKLGDDVICITQAVKNVDRIFRSLAQDFTSVRNLSKERMGMFKLPSVFLRKTFGCEPGPTAQVMEMKTFTLDVSGIAKCYNTAAGVGIHSKLADTERKLSGVPFWVGCVVVVAVIAAIAFGAPPVIASMFKTPVDIITAKPGPVRSVPVVSPPAIPPSPSVVRSALPGHTSMSLEVKNSTSIFMSGTSYLDGKLRVYLSDGRSFTLGDPRLEWVTTSACRINGEIFYMR